MNTYVCVDMRATLMLSNHSFLLSIHIAGAILPGMDAADGAKAGAAVGATSGGVRALRGRRIARRMG